MGALVDMTAQRFGRLVVLERAGSDASAHTTWRCLCDCGNETVVRGDHLRAGSSQSCGCGSRAGGPAHYRWMVEDVSYTAAHRRVVVARGPASEHTCACGDQAAHWSYDEAPGEHSTRIEDYSPRCRSCHKRYDNLLRYLLGAA